MEGRDEKIIRYTGANNQLLGIPTEGKGREWWGKQYGKFWDVEERRYKVRPKSYISSLILGSW